MQISLSLELPQMYSCIQTNDERIRLLAQSLIIGGGATMCVAGSLMLGASLPVACVTTGAVVLTSLFFTSHVTENLPAESMPCAEKETAVSTLPPPLEEKRYDLSCETASGSIEHILYPNEVAHINAREKLTNASIYAFFLLLESSKKKNGIFPVVVSYQELLRTTWKKGGTYLSSLNLKDTRYIFIPRFVLEKHFTFVAVDLEKGVIHYFDPDGDADHSKDEFLEELQYELTFDADALIARFPYRSKYTIQCETTRASGFRTQMRGEEFCGFYICAYALAFLGEPFPGTSSDVVQRVQAFFREMIPTSL